MLTEWDAYLVPLLVLILGLFILGAAFSAFYRRSQNDTTYVRTGLGGEKVIMGSGAFVLPIVHEVLPINMQTMRIEIAREMEQALVTKDPLRVDVTAEFFLRVAPNEAAISTAARALGKRTMDEAQIKLIFEAPCVAALRSVAAGMELDELHQKRADFERNVEEAVDAEFRKNGMELVLVSLTRLDQTDKGYFDAHNSFDARGLTILEEIISENEKRRNQIAQDNSVAVKQKNLEATKKKELLDLEEKQAQNDAKRNKAENDAETQRKIEELTIQKDLLIEQFQQKANIQQAFMEREASEAWIETNRIKAEYEKIYEEIRTAREVAEAERRQQLTIINAETDAQRQKLLAAANKEAEHLASEAMRIRYEIEAVGKRILNEAANQLSPEQIAMQVKMEVLKQLPSIIKESVKPMENIEGIKIIHMDGLTRSLNSASSENAPSSNGLADQVVDSALRYRAHVPLIDSLLNEVGIKSVNLKDITQNLQQELQPPQLVSSNKKSESKALETNEEDEDDEDRH